MVRLRRRSLSQIHSGRIVGQRDALLDDGDHSFLFPPGFRRKKSAASTWAGPTSFMCLARLPTCQKSYFFLLVSGSNAATTSNIGAICHAEVTSRRPRNPNSWPKISALFFASFDKRPRFSAGPNQSLPASFNIPTLWLEQTSLRLNKDDFRT